jgi:protoporphyrinogen oxidase
MRVDIIGAGISGLATAYFLTQNHPELDLHVWEKDSSPGGLAGCFSAEGFTVEKFYHHIFRSDSHLIELLEGLDLGDELMWRPANTGSYYFQQAYRLSSPADILKFKPLPFLDRIRLGLMVVHARTVRDWRRLDEISAEDYIRRTAGSKVFEILWQPLLHGKFGDLSGHISAAWLWSKLVDRGGSRNRKGHEVLGYLRGGLGRMFDRLIEEIESAGGRVHLSKGIEGLTWQGDRIDSIVTREGTYPTDLVISGAQIPDLCRLLPESSDSLQQRLSRIEFLGNVCLVLVLPRQLSQFYWTNVMDPDAPFVGIIEQTNWVDPVDLNRKRLVYISAYCPSSDERFRMTAEELLEFYLPWIQRLFPSFTTEEVERALVWTADYAQPVVTTGYSSLIPAIETPVANLLLCTMAQIFPQDRQVSNGVKLAKQTAKIAADFLQEKGK